MDEQNVNQHIEAGLALFANKQRELQALAAHVEQEKAQLLAMQQAPMPFPMVNPYLAMGGQQQMPFSQQAVPPQQPLPEQSAPAEMQQPVTPQPPHTAAPSPMTTSSTSSLEADVRMLARGLDQQAANFNAALERVMSTLNDFSRRLVLLEGGQSSSPTFEEVFDTAPTATIAAEAAPAAVEEVAPAPEPPVPAHIVDNDVLAKRVDLLSINVQRLTKLVDMVLEQQLRTNEHLQELLDFLSAQFGYSAREKAEPAVVLETPYVASTAADVVDVNPADTAPKKSNKHKKNKNKSKSKKKR